MPIDTLEQRLTDLEFEGPDPGRITARILSDARRPGHSRLPRGLALVAATLLIAFGVLYFVPAADAALADAPIAGQLLRDAGLAGAANRVTSVGAVSTSSGYRLELVGAYADSSRTVLLIHSTPAIGLGGQTGLELTDQFGRSYSWSSGMSDGSTGDVVLQFEALAWPDALTGARIRLHLSSIEPYECAIAADFGCKTVDGAWNLPATIGVDEGTALPLPEPARIGPASVRFTSVKATSATIAVTLEITGVTMSDLDQLVPDGGKGKPRFTIDLVGPNGDSADGGWDESQDPAAVHITFLGYRSVPGKYRLHVSYLGGGEFDRFLSVP